jgi:hypothetical protein
MTGRVMAERTLAFVPVIARRALARRGNPATAEAPPWIASLRSQ